MKTQNNFSPLKNDKKLEMFTRSRVPWDTKLSKIEAALLIVKTQNWYKSKIRDLFEEERLKFKHIFTVVFSSVHAFILFVFHSSRKKLRSRPCWALHSVFILAFLLYTRKNWLSFPFRSTNNEFFSRKEIIV